MNGFKAVLRTSVGMRLLKRHEGDRKWGLGKEKATQLKKMTFLRSSVSVFLIDCEIKEGMRILVIFQDIPVFSHIIQKVSARAYH